MSRRANEAPVASGPMSFPHAAREGGHQGPRRENRIGSPGRGGHMSRRANEARFASGPMSFPHAAREGA
jgi:hypothetical protein